MSNGKVALIILDGYGIGEPNDGNAIYMAQTPVMDGLLQRWPHTKLSASGLDVGLPDGQMGNSEVGHTNIGSGRVVFQDLPRITKAIEDGTFFENPVYAAALDNAANGKALHILGLLSDGGVHSHIRHIFAMVKWRTTAASGACTCTASSTDAMLRPRAARAMSGSCVTTAPNSAPE